MGPSPEWADNLLVNSLDGEQLRALFAGVLAAMFLWSFYRTVESNWPESYSALTDAVENFMVRTIFRHLAFRLFPFYVVLVFAATIVEATLKSSAVTTTLAAAAVLHVLNTNVRATVLAWRHGGVRSSVLLYRVALSIALFAVAFLVSRTFRIWRLWIPAPQEFTNVIWTAILASVLATIAQRLIWSPAPDSSQLLRQARQDIGSHLLELCRNQARVHDTDPHLMEAIICAEALQRPRWLRRSEQLKGRLMKSGSYGVAQIQASSPITDEESIRILARQFHGYYPPRTEPYRMIDGPRLGSRIEMHNPDRNFSSLVRRLFEESAPYALEFSGAQAKDYRGVVEVLRVSRRIHNWEISGTAWIEADNLRIRYQLQNGREDAFFVQLGSGSGRRTWRISLPIETERLWVRPRGVPRGELSDRRVIFDPSDYTDE